VLDLEEFTPVPELLDDPVVPIVLMHHKLPIVPLEIVSEDIDLSCVMVGQGIQPFEKITHAMLAYELNGTIIVFGFGHDEISDVLFLGLHGFNIKEDMKGWQVVFFLLLLGCGIHPRPTFGARPSRPFPLSFLLVLSGYLHEASMSCTVHVLMTGGAINVPTLMFFNLV